MPNQQLLDELQTYESEYREYRELFESDGEVDPSEQAQLDQIETMIGQIRQSINDQSSTNGDVCIDESQPVPMSSDDVCVDESQPAPSADEEMCIDDSQPAPSPEEDMCVDDSTPAPTPAPEEDMCVDETPPQPGPQPAQCGGDDTGTNADSPVTVPPPQDGGSPFDDSSMTFNGSGTLVVSGGATSQSNFPGGTTGTVSIDAGQSGTVRIDMHIEAFQDNMAVNESFTQDFSVTWEISADQQGNLTISGGSTDVGRHTGGTWMRLDSVNPSAGRNYVQVEPKVVGGQVTGGISVGVGLETTAAPSFIQKPFRLNITVCNIPQPTPTPTPTTASHRVLFERPRQDSVSGAEEGKLIRWYQALSETTRQRIEAGDEVITVTGFASTTGGEQMNRQLSETRATNVAGILRSYAGSSVRFNTRGRGEYNAQTPDNVEDDSERRAEVSVMQTN